MATADEIFEQLAEAVPEHDHRVIDSDTYFIINPITRQISNVTSSKNVLMQFDHDSERFTFELPRFVEGHDMMLCNSVKVHYNNISSEFGDENIGTYDVDDLRIDPNNLDVVICTWLISRNATMYAGPLSFIVQYACIDNDGNVVYEWYSDIYSDIEIKTGRNNGEASVIEYTDVLEQWRAKLFGVEDSVTANIVSASETQQTEIAAKGAETLATIPEDYTEVANMAEEALRRKSDAILVTETDDLVKLDDASDNKLVGLNIYGKTTQVTTNGYQLFNANDLVSRTMGKAKVDNNGDGSFTISHNSQGDDIDFLLYHDYTHEETLTLINKVGTYYLRTEQATSPYVYVAFSIDGAFNYELQCRSGSVSSLQITDEMLNNTTFCMRIGFYGFANTAVTPAVVKPMLYIDGDGTWEAFSGGIAGPNPDYPMELNSSTSPTTTIYGKNLVEPKTNNIYGYTSVVNSDGSITITGAANTTDPIYIMMTTTSDDNPLILYKGVNYSMSGESTSDVNVGVKTIMNGGLIEWTLIDDWNRLVGSNPNKNRIAQFFLESSGHVVGDTRLCGTYKIQLEVNYGNTSFEGFKPKQTMDMTYTLHGIPVDSGGNYIDGNGQHWICDEIDFERGKYIQRVMSLTLDGTQTFGINNYQLQYFGGYAFETYVPAITGQSVEIPVMSSHLPRRLWGVYAIDKDGVYATAGRILINFGDQTIKTVEELQAYLQVNPIDVIYERDTPIETDLTSAEMEAFRALHTNATNTTILNDQNAMIGVKYVADVKRYIYKNCNVKRKFDLTLLESNWIGHENDTYFTQVVDLDVGEDVKIDLHPTAAQLIDLLQDGISMFVANENGVVTVYSVGGYPGTITIRATETVVYYE